MIRNMIRVWALVLVLMLSASAVYAGDNIKDTLENSVKVESMLNPSEEEMYAQMLKQLPLDEARLISGGKMGAESLVKSKTLSQGGIKKVTSAYYYTTLTMPSANFYIVTLGWKDNNYTSCTYNGVSCYKFTRGNTDVYVKQTAFYPDSTSNYDRSGRCASDSDVSTNVTNYLNSGNSSFYYSGKWRTYNADGIRYVQLALYGTQAFKYEQDEVAMQHKVVAAAGDSALTNTTALKYPSMKLEIKNTGAGRRYFGGYWIKGVGSNTSVTDISDLIQLGYKTTKVLASATVSNLSFSDVASLFDTCVLLNKTGVSTKTYISDTVALSNTALGIYSYSCSLKCPFALGSTNAYFQAHVGLNGSDGASLSYKVTFTSSSTR